MRECPDCGPVAVSHAVERWSNEFDWIFDRISRPMDAIWGSLKPFVALLRPGRLAPVIFKICAALRLGRILAHADEKNTWRARVLWEEAERRGILMYEFRPFGLPREIFWATRRDPQTGENDTRSFDGLPRPRRANGAALDWMDDKGIILEKFRRAGIPVPRGGVARTERDAIRIFQNIINEKRAVQAVRAKGRASMDDLVHAVIVKPALGSRSRHTYMHLTDQDELLRAFRKAQEISSRVVIEEEIPGFVFRVTLVGGKIAGVMRREPPHVVGDDVHTVRELVAEENKNPSRHGPIFHEIAIGAEALEVLREQGLSLDARPRKGEVVILHPKVSRSFGASTTEIAMKDVHPENTALFLKIAETLNDPLVGVDFIMEDAAESWRIQKCGVIECNSLPFIDLHHFPYRGAARNVAALVWDIAFS